MYLFTYFYLILFYFIGWGMRVGLETLSYMTETQITTFILSELTLRAPTCRYVEQWCHGSQWPHTSKPSVTRTILSRILYYGENSDFMKNKMMTSWTQFVTSTTKVVFPTHIPLSLPNPTISISRVCVECRMTQKNKKKMWSEYMTVQT